MICIRSPVHTFQLTDRLLIIELACNFGSGPKRADTLAHLCWVNSGIPQTKVVSQDLEPNENHVPRKFYISIIFAITHS